MNTVTPVLITWKQMRERMRNHPLRCTEIPVEYQVSLPIPTLRFGLMTYAFFANPIRRDMHGDFQCAPDRWWVISVNGGNLVAYGLVDAFPFTEHSSDSSPDCINLMLTIDELRDCLDKLDELMTHASQEFFTGLPGTSRELVEQSLTEVMTNFANPFYRMLAPDFWSWLEN